MLWGQGLLGNAELCGGCLQVVVVWPGWEDTPGFVLLTSSPLMRRLVVLDKGDHTYKEGYQHRSGVLYRRSQARSHVFFMQTEAAAKKWPVTEEKVEEFRRCFQHSGDTSMKQTEYRKGHDRGNARR